MSLVFATDFSDTASQAATAAALLAARGKLKLWLVHAVPANSLKRLGEPFRHATERALQEEADRLNALGADVGVDLLSGSLDEALLAFCGRVDARAILVGPPSAPPSLTGVGGSLDRLASRADRPLFVLRAPGGLLPWARGERPLEVLLGFDRTAATQAALAFVQGLREFGEVALQVGHVIYPAEEASRLGLKRPATFDAVEPQLRASLEAEISAQIGPQPDGSQAPVNLVVGVGRKADHLTELARELGSDLLVVGTHHRRALAKLWSVSHHVLRTSPCAVATVPASAFVASEAGPSLPRLGSVVAATDFSLLGNRAIPYAFASVAQGGTVHLVHVSDTPVSPDQERAIHQRLLDLVPDGVRARAVRAIPEVIQPHAGADPATRIAQAAERHGADLVVIGSHGRSGLSELVLGSVARGVMERLRRPLLVVRGED